MEAWRKVWREGVLPQLSEENLRTLLAALEGDDPALVQGVTTTPPPLQAVQDWPVESCCPISYIGWKDGLETVGEVDTFFADMCQEIDRRIGEPAGCRYLINWIDETPREVMRAELGDEVRRSLDDRPKVDSLVEREGRFRESGRLPKGDQIEVAFLEG